MREPYQRLSRGFNEVIFINTWQLAQHLILGPLRADELDIDVQIVRFCLGCLVCLVPLHGSYKKVQSF